jgi:hypothetical protein
MTIIIILFLLIGAAGGTSINDLPKTIQRFNWGINMVRGPTIINGVSKFRHTYQINIPRLQFTPIDYLECTTEDMRAMHCEAANMAIANINQVTEPIFADLNKKLNDWLGAIPNIDSVNINRRRRRETTLGPNFCQNIEAATASTGSFLGKIFSSFTGLPSSDDIKIVNKHICQLADVVKTNSDQVVHLGQTLDSFSQAVDGRMLVLENALDDIRGAVLSTQSELVRISDHISDAINDLERKLTYTALGTQLLFALLESISKYLSQIHEIQSNVMRFGDGINTLMSGHLPASLVSFEQVQSVVESIVNEQSKHGNRFRLMEQNPSFYYLTDNVSFTKSLKTNKLYIMVTFPITSTGGMMASYRIDRTFLGMEHSNVSTRIEDLPDFIAVSADRQYYMELNAADMLACKGTTVKTCTNERSMQSFTQSTCAAAIYEDNTNKILEICDIRYDKEPQPSAVVHIDGSSFVAHSSNPEGRIWTSLCTDITGTGKTILRTQPACASCMITVECGCDFNAPGEFYIPPQLVDCDKFVGGAIPEVKRHFVANLPLLHAHFDSEKLKNINGRTISQDEIYTVPPVEPLSNKWDDVVEKSQQYSTELKRLAKDTKASTVVYATKADALLKEAMDFTDLNKNKITGLVDMFQGWEWLGTSSTGASTSLLIITIILPILAIAMGIYVICFNNR